MKKIVIIKLGALGDVVRTLPLASAIRKKYEKEEGCEITWVTKKDASEILEGNTDITTIAVLPFSTQGKEYDALYNFDIEDEATTLAEEIHAQAKFGFYKEGGYALAYSMGAEEYLNTLFDDAIKKSNRKTYQELMFMAAELPFDSTPYRIALKNEEIDGAKAFLEKEHIPQNKLIGIHIGASPRWPSKVWADEKVEEFIELASHQGYSLLILSGPSEKAKQQQIVTKMNVKGIRIYANNPDNTRREFAALVSLCDAMICSDSFSLHVSIGLGKPTVGLFFCTSPFEVEGYGLLKKAVSPKLMEFFPEKMDQFSEELVNSISAKEVLDAVKSIL